MGTQIDAFEAQRQLPALFERLERGEQFTITKDVMRLRISYRFAALYRTTP